MGNNSRAIGVGCTRPPPLSVTRERAAASNEVDPPAILGIRKRFFMRHLTARPRIFVSILALALALPLAAQSKNEKDLKNIGHRGVGDGMNFYSLEKEIALGKSLAEKFDATARIEKDPVVNEYINRLTQNLVRHSDAK